MLRSTDREVCVSTTLLRICCCLLSYKKKTKNKNKNVKQTDKKSHQKATKKGTWAEEVARSLDKEMSQRKVHLIWESPAPMVKRYKTPLLFCFILHLRNADALL